MAGVRLRLFVVCWDHMHQLWGSDHASLPNCTFNCVTWKSVTAGIVTPWKSVKSTENFVYVFLFLELLIKHLSAFDLTFYTFNKRSNEVTFQDQQDHSLKIHVLSPVLLCIDQITSIIKSSKQTPLEVFSFPARAKMQLVKNVRGKHCVTRTIQSESAD